MKALAALVVFLLLHATAHAAAEEVKFGRAIYRSYCAGCHGMQAHGDGWMVKYLARRPARLTDLARRNGGEFPRDLVLSRIDGRDEVKMHGPRDMPVWGDRMERTLVQGAPAAKRRMEALADYLATIQE